MMLDPLGQWGDVSPANLFHEVFQPLLFPALLIQTPRRYLARHGPNLSHHFFSASGPAPATEEESPHKQEPNRRAKPSSGLGVSI